MREVMEREGFDFILAFSYAKLQADVRYLHRWDSTDSRRTFALVDEGRVKTVDGGNSLEEANEAFVALQSGDVVGWVVPDVGACRE